MNELAVSVHTGIGATGAVNPHSPVGYGAECRLKGTLDSLYIEVRLGLPAVVGAAVIFNPARHPTAVGQWIGGEA